jgi:hypothetical protein
MRGHAHGPDEVFDIDGLDELESIWKDNEDNVRGLELARLQKENKELKLQLAVEVERRQQKEAMDNGKVQMCSCFVKELETLRKKA